MIGHVEGIQVIFFVLHFILFCHMTDVHYLYSVFRSEPFLFEEDGSFSFIKIPMSLFYHALIESVLSFWSGLGVFKLFETDCEMDCL